MRYKLKCKRYSVWIIYLSCTSRTGLGWKLDAAVNALSSAQRVQILKKKMFVSRCSKFAFAKRITLDFNVCPDTTIRPG